MSEELRSRVCCVERQLLLETVIYPRCDSLAVTSLSLIDHIFTPCSKAGSPLCKRFPSPKEKPNRSRRATSNGVMYLADILFFICVFPPLKYPTLEACNLSALYEVTSEETGICLSLLIIFLSCCWVFFPLEKATRVVVARLRGCKTA